jgi:hypothetical protein
MTDATFVLTLGICLTLLLGWGFKTLPREQWQIMATLPLRKEPSGTWVGVNITYYGLLTASAGLAAIVTFLMLMASIHASMSAAVIAVGVVLAVCLPASRLVARVVEKKRHTSTVAGAVFVGLLVAPLVVAAINALAGPDAKTPIGATIAAMTVAYIMGEGLGRLACISFGCCYGKPITQVGHSARRLFEKFHFAFSGPTKKIAYASGLEGIKVVPIQALTSTLYVAVGLIGMFLFLQSFYRTAYVVTIIASQAWRVYSETLRADYRGDSKISVYQKMAVGVMIYAVAILAMFPGSPDLKADLTAGLTALWDPLVILVLQSIWVVIFLCTGWSMVTGSVLSFHVHRDRI